MLDILLSGLNCRCLFYLDDVNVFSKSLENHLEDVYMVLTTLRKAEASLKLKKGCFFTGSVKNLEHIEKLRALTISKARVKLLNQLQHPRNVAELRSFHVLCNLYQCFVPN